MMARQQQQQRQQQHQHEHVVAVSLTCDTKNLLKLESFFRRTIFISCRKTELDQNNHARVLVVTIPPKYNSIRAVPSITSFSIIILIWSVPSYPLHHNTSRDDAHVWSGVLLFMVKLESQRLLLSHLLNQIAARFFDATVCQMVADP